MSSSCVLVVVLVVVVVVAVVVVEVVVRKRGSVRITILICRALTPIQETGRNLGAAQGRERVCRMELKMRRQSRDKSRSLLAFAFDFIGFKKNRVVAAVSHMVIAALHSSGSGVLEASTRTL